MISFFIISAMKGASEGLFINLTSRMIASRKSALNVLTLIALKSELFWAELSLTSEITSPTRVNQDPGATPGKVPAGRRL